MKVFLKDVWRFFWSHTSDNAFVTGGERGDKELLTACTGNLLVAAWGAGVPFGRDKECLKMFKHSCPDKQIYCLGKTKNGSPRHPLYVKADTQPMLLVG